jgi:hypothetical protein
LPRRPRQHEIGDRAVNAVEGVILSGGWIFRRQPGSDYGIDAEVANIALPVFVALHDQGEDRVYVAVPPTEIPDSARVRVYIERANRLDETLAGLKQSMFGWYSGYGEHTIAEIPAYGRMFERLEEAAEFDFFMPLEPALDDELRLFYRHLFRLVLRARQPVSVLPPLGWWYAIDAIFWPDQDRFHYGTLDLFVRFVSPVYREARLQPHARAGNE